MTAARDRFIAAGILFLAGQLGGCFYLQAARGQLDLLARREPIAEVLADPATSAVLAERLRLVQIARDFSIEELEMPDNGSYRSYADLERDYALWSLFAAPELSLDPVNWCYPIVGCVSYRGWFRIESATRQADKLARRGFDVYVAGIPAYSTLGRFDDPVLNTMLRWDELQLIATLFHELAHQLLYIPDDTAFNESFASAVAEFSMERFLTSRDAPAELEDYRTRLRVRQALGGLVAAARLDLETYYAETLDDDEKRLLKEHRLERLVADIRGMLNVRGGSADAFLEGPWNNARLLTFNLYDAWLPAFRQLYRDCEQAIDCFYAAAHRAAEMERDARERYLEELATRSAGSAG